MARRKKKGKGLKIAVVVMLVLVAGACAAEAGILIKNKNSGTFLKGSRFMGEDIEGKTPEQILDKVTGQADEVSIVLTEKGETALSGKLADFGYSLDKDKAGASLNKALSDQKSSLINIARILLGTENTEVTADVAWNFDEKTFDKKVAAENFPVKRTASKDAKLVNDKKNLSVKIRSEVVGDEFDEGKLQEWVRKEIDSSLNEKGAENISLAFPEELYILPEVYSDDPSLVDRMKALNTYAGAQITYTFGSETLVLDHETIMSWVKVNGSSGSLDMDKVSEFLDSMVSKYNTRYRSRTFMTTGGYEITIPDNKNEYGYRIYRDKETEQLLADVTSGAPVEREPVYVKTNEWDNPLYLKREGTDDLAGTYVEVSIKKQHVWYYVDGECIVSTDCVTGDVTKDRGTTTGAYPLAYKITDYTLTGGNGNGAYASPVSYWMPFYEGQGLHDATWRSSFGGSIYKGNGSHGCVNLPKKAAAKIYENIKAGTAIIIYDE